MFIVGVILLLAITVFVLENRSPVTIEFLAWRYDTQVGLALLAAAVAGAVVIYISGLLKQRDLRAQTRTAEAKVRELERQQRLAERQAASGEGQPTAHP
jgi:uncharacterized integral membrane protein